MGAHDRWTAMGCTGASRDEVRLRAAFAAAEQIGASAEPAARRRAKATMASLTGELARHLERSGREHLASALWP